MSEHEPANRENPRETLDLLLINPSLDWKLDQREKIVKRIEENIPNQETPHIGMAYLLAVAKKLGLKARYMDMVMEGFSVEQLLDYVTKTRPALIGFTAFTIQIRTAGIIASRIKSEAPGAIICVGGPHATAIPQQTLEEFPAFDFVVCGEGEELLPKLFVSLGGEDGLAKLPGVLTRKGGDVSWNPIANLDALPFPAWEEFDLSKYPGTYPHRTRLELPMVSERGCPYRCVFCCRSLGDALRRRSVHSVITEIERNIEEFKCESIAFLDETFVLNMKWADEFFTAMLARGLNKKITWSCSTRVSNTSPELLRRMREAGCYYVFFGLESADDAALKHIKKGVTVEQIRNAVKWAKQAGIVPVGSFIIGLPGDTEEHAFKAIELAEELELYSVTFPIAVPFPGTELREMALKNEYGMRIVSNNWDHYGKQDPGVMESEDLSWSRRKELQRLAYMRHPKKNLDNYLQRLQEMGDVL
jgi:anaerobic magnesium-protoporphyrin IX monomethyl ester cyclase